MALYESALEELGLAPLWVRRGTAAAQAAGVSGEGAADGVQGSAAAQLSADPAQAHAVAHHSRDTRHAAAAFAGHGQPGSQAPGAEAAGGVSAPASRAGAIPQTVPRNVGMQAPGTAREARAAEPTDSDLQPSSRVMAAREGAGASAPQAIPRRDAQPFGEDVEPLAADQALPQAAMPAADAREPARRGAAPNVPHPVPHPAPAPVEEDMSWFDEMPLAPPTRPAHSPSGQPSADAADSSASLPPVTLLDWDALAARVAGCERCRLCEKRTNTVFGVGDREADWMLIGEAPGENEDRQGEPFVGQAGKLLDNMLRSLSLARDTNVYIANVIKCRPPGNRNPEPDEVARCEPFLQRQVALVRPKLIVALGRFAAQSLLKTDASISSLRGRVHEYEGVPVIVTYHPAYLLRSLHDKAKSWQDLCLARDTWRNAGGLVDGAPAAGARS